MTEPSEPKHPSEPDAESDADASTESQPGLESPAEPASKEPPPIAAPARDSKPKKRAGKKEKKKYDSLNAYLWHEWVRPLGTILIILGVIRSGLIDWNDVPSGSMEPSVLTGDRIGVDKRAYGFHVPFTKDKWIGSRWGKPDRGDIVVAYSPDPKDPVRIVKRIVAVPGDTIAVKNGRIILNGEPIEYAEADPQVAGRYLTATQRALGEFYEERLPASDEGDDDGFVPHFVRFTPDAPKNRSMDEITLGEDEYFFMGDNRDESKDGRVYGVTPGNRIVGEAIGVAFSLNHQQYFLPRITRFFSGLR